MGSAGTPLGNMVIKLGLDDADFGKGVANSKKEVRYLAKEMQANMKIADMAGNQMGKLGTKYNSLTDIIKAQEKQVASLKTAYEGSFVDGKATDSTIRLGTELQNANGKLASYRQQLATTAGAMADMQVRTTGVTGAINTASGKMISAGKQMSSIGGSLTKAVTVPIVGMATAVTSAAMSWESDFAGVKKTNDEVVDSTGRVVYSYQDLENGLRGLAKELPATHSEIAGVAEAAGQLGIKTEDVVSFTKTMIDMGESTNLSAEDAATAIAKIANITGMTSDEYERFGSATVALGNNFATTESDIVQMSTRLASAGTLAGLTETEILGLATAMSSVGIESEAGGTAMTQTLNSMENAATKGAGAFDTLQERAESSGSSLSELSLAVEHGGKELTAYAKSIGLAPQNLKKMYNEANKSAGALQQFADISGMSSAQFVSAWKDKPITAIQAFIKGLGELDEKGDSATQVLDDMGLSGIRQSNMLKSLALASDTLTGAIDMSNSAWEENTALTNEATTRYETTESKLKMLKNEAKDAAIELGGPLVDGLRDGLQAAKPLIKGLGDLAKAFSDADPKTQKMIISLAAAAAGAGPLLSVTGKLTGGIGKLGGAFVDLSAKAAKKKAIEAVTKSFLENNTSAETLFGTLAGGTATMANFGSAASTASGAGGVGAMTGALGGLSPVLLGIVGVGGALALGYGAWKLFGEEAYNSAQRTKEWGSDVGESTGQALTDVKTYSTEAGGQFDLLSQGLTTNTDEMVGNFAKMGESIETNLTGKIETLKSLLNDLPEDVKSAGEQITNDEITNQEKYLETVKTNNERIGQIRQQAADNHRQITVEEAAQIKALSEESATAYVNSFGKSESETKQILSAMTGNVETASEDQAKAWLQSLGKQRQDSKIEYGKMQEDLKSKLVDAGYDLNSDYAKQMLELLQTSSDSATQLTEDQMSLILGKYPELAEEVFLANGQLISSMGDAGQSAVAQNKTMMESFGNMADQAAKTAEENKDKLKLVMDEADNFGAFWNGLVLDPKTGEVKTNAQEEVNKAAQSEQGWNQLMWISKDANVTSNVKMMIAEAAIANGKWDSMTFTEQQALLDSNVTQTMTQALEAKGDWKNLNFEQKKALIYSNTPETMAETMLSLGMWDKYQPEIKDLKAENYDFLNTLSQSEDKMKNWNETPNAVKQIQGENYDFLNKIYSSEEAYNGWKSIPNDTKIMLANNDDLLLKLSTSKTDLDAWNAMTPDVKQMLANNEDLANKVFASEESLNAWNSLKPEMKNMLANNEDILEKVQSGEISIADYDAIKPALKKLLGDSANVQNASKTGSNALDTYNRNNPGLKKLLGNASSAQQASSQGVQSIANWNRTSPKTNRLNTHDYSSSVVDSARNTYYSYPNGQNRENTVTTRHRTIWETIKSVFTKNAAGTNYHRGGLAMVNDQRGPLYRELVAEPDGSMYIPQGRNVMLDLQRGSKIYTASETKRLVPHYANGVGVPENSSLVHNLRALNDSKTVTTNTISIEQKDYDAKFDALIDLMGQFSNNLRNLKIIMREREIGQAVTNEKNRTDRLQARIEGIR